MPENNQRLHPIDIHVSYPVTQWNEERIYVAGPMRGYAKWNFPAFDKARDTLLSEGYQVISPADLDRARGITEDVTEFSSDDFATAIRIDTEAILCCTGVYMLIGWEASTGARYEKTLCQTMKKDIYYEPGAVQADTSIHIIEPGEITNGE